MGVSGFDTITATRINIVNDAGKIQAVLTSDKSGGRVEIFKSDGEYQAILGVDHDGGNLVFYDKNEKKAAILGVDKPGRDMAFDDLPGERLPIPGPDEDAGPWDDNTTNKWLEKYLESARRDQTATDADQSDLMRSIVEGRLYDTTKMRYDLYLQTAEWQTLRRIKMEAAGHRCQICNSDAGPLEVHHRTYERRGKERLDDLTVLCRRCHQVYHDADGIPSYPPERPRPTNHPAAQKLR